MSIIDKQDSTCSFDEVGDKMAGSQSVRRGSLAKILVVEDDTTLCKFIAEWLALDHHHSEIVNTGDEALSRLKAYEYDLVILDLELPNIAGMEILREFRKSGGTTPVLILTGLKKIEDKVSGFDAGADDYLTKPFHGNELRARLRALLRRAGNAYLEDILRSGDLTLDAMNYKVTKSGCEIRLRPKEFALLEFLMRHPGRVFQQEALLNRVWATESDATIDALTTCVRRLRQKIDDEGKPSIIRTVHGVGYGLEAGDN